MSLLKYVSRIQRMHRLIKMKATGSSIEFANKMGISRSILMDSIKDMKEMGAPIEYCRRRHSYFYAKDCDLIIDFKSYELNNEDKRKIFGGRGFLSKFLPFNETVKLW